MKQIIVLGPKKIITVALAAILAISSMTVSAQVDEPHTLAYNTTPFTTSSSEAPRNNMRVNITQEKTGDLLFRVSIDNPTTDKATIIIRDAQNNTLHRETVNASSTFVTRYNFQSLEDGAYMISVISGKQKIQKAIDIKTKTEVQRFVSID
ncbi:hypothetical protein LX64_04736 [Chitinophaga skermanii]|uniref:Secreted protein (Por secretion system target) n=1 Tax=Chitinophaga skermanii TaxID=331697 RepID=A0A327Q4U3_9BACT|nr:hypothetical protein [Chitinophaga skermanii]RAI98751.1 hypothetical protein LX64_04736 [Chitinophaga skermanii]